MLEDVRRDAVVQAEKAKVNEAGPAIRPIDGDGHLVEKPEQLLEYLEPPYAEYYLGGTKTGGPTPHDGWNRSRFGRPKHGGRGDSTKDWLEALEWGNLELSGLYPTLGLFSGFIKDPDYAAAYCRAYNNWMVNDVCKPSSGKIVGVALLPVQDPQEATAELRRARTELGLSAAMLCADGSHLLGHKELHHLRKLG